MSARNPQRLALIVRGHPWRRRAARADLDLALAAAAMDYDLEVYFLGDALLQLADKRQCEAALLPSGYRAWGALPGLADARFYAEREWLERCDRSRIRLILPVRALGADQMRAGWRSCHHALVV
jgi:sulfur relay (sulfurtransferase) DsrF/TusC family protein